jgi:hypothetical protein
LTFTRLHGIISQKTELFIVTAVRNSNPTQTEGVGEQVAEKNIWIQKRLCCRRLENTA